MYCDTSANKEPVLWYNASDEPLTRFMHLISVYNLFVFRLRGKKKQLKETASLTLSGVRDDV